MRDYCLYCFATLQRENDACFQCGRKNFVALRQRYWNRSPRLLLLQRAIILISFALTAYACWKAMVQIPGRPSGPVVLTIIFFHAMIVLTARTLTQNSTYFKPSVFWPLIFALLGPWLAIAVAWPWIFTSLLAVVSLRAARVGNSWKQQLQAGAA